MITSIEPHPNYHLDFFFLFLYFSYSVDIYYQYFGKFLPIN